MIGSEMLAYFGASDALSGNTPRVARMVACLYRSSDISKAYRGSD